MRQDNNTVILRVQLSEEDTEKRLSELAVKLTDTRKASQDLTKAYNLGKLSADEFGQQSVKLNGELRATQTEQRNLTKTLDAYRAAQAAQAGSYEQAQKQLDVANLQFQKTAGSQDLSTESAKALSATIAELRGQLTQTDAANQLFVRSVGNYPKGESLAPLIQQLVRLEEIQKSGTLTAQEAADVDAQIPGFKQRIAQAGAQEGKSYEDTTALVKTYGDAIRPATAALVQLEAEQKEVTESGKATGEQVAQIGFRFGQAQKSIKDATDALKVVPEEAAEATKETKGLGGSLLDAAKSSDALGGAVEVLSTAKEKYTVAANLAKAATAGEVTVLGLLKLALLATGLGAFVVILGSLIAFLTKSQVGVDFLSRKMAALGAVVRVITNLAVDFGGKLIAAAENPRQAFSDLVDFLETNLLNRFKAIGVLIDAIRNRDFTKLTDGVVQLGTGITDATAKTKALAQQMASAATSAEAIEQETQRIREAERALNVERDQSRAKIEGLKKASDDTTKSVATRTVAAKEAAAIENGLLAEQLKLQDDKIANLKAAQALQKNLTTEDKDALAELQSERAKTAQESFTLQTELQNKINSLNQEGIDKSIAGRAQAIALEVALLNKRLAQVRVNSDEELSIRQQLLNKERDAELNVKNLTIKQKKAIDVKYEQDSLALTLDFNRRRMLAALQSELDLTSAKLAQQTTTGADLLTLQAQQIEQQRQQAIAGLAANADNDAKIAAINAQAAQQQRMLEYQQATKDLLAYLDEKRRIVEADYASGAIQEEEYQRRIAAIAKAGTDAQTVINDDYRQDNTENQKQADSNEIDGIRQHTAQVKKQEEAKQQVRGETVQAFTDAADSVIAAFGAESAAGQAALALKKSAALVEVALSLEKQFAANAETGSKISAIAPPYTTPLGVAYTIAADAVAVIAAAKSVGNISKLQQGGIADGPSHAQGGIQVYKNGRHTGIEIEGGEPVLTKGVSQNPLLLRLASTVNQLAGGRALVPNFPVPHMAAGGVAQAVVLDQLRGDVASASPAAIGKAVADSLRKNPPVNRWSDFEKAQARNKFTDRQASS